MTTIKIVSLVVVLLLAVIAGVLVVLKSKKHDLIKWISIFIFVALALTWIFGTGQFEGSEFVDYGMHQQGITDLTTLLYYGINLAEEKIIFLLSLGIFYAVLSKCNGYKNLVHSIAQKFKGKESKIVFVLVASIIFTLMGSMLSQTFIALVFVPFIISVVLAMGFDKMTAFCATFGSVLVGILGIVYGSDGLYWFNYYIDTTITTGILYRVIVLVVAFGLFNFFNVLHMRKVLDDKKLDEVASDPFKVEKADKKSSSIFVIITLAILFVIIILGYIDWSTNFGINIFTKVHNKLMEFTIKDFAVFSKILGSESAQLGSWNLYPMAIIMFVASAIVALVNRIKLNDFITACGEGIKKIGLPIIVLIGTYTVFVTVYACQIIPTITNVLIKNTTAFNPLLISLDALIANIFHIDLGLTGFFVGSFLASVYAANIEVIHTIFVLLFGLVSLCVPTSSILVIGLSYLGIEYKSWIKYSWLFLLGMLLIIIAIVAVMLYI